MSQDIDARLRAILDRILGASVAEEIAERPGRSHPAWDSIAHINVVMAVEQEFRVSFSPEEAGMTTTLEALRDALQVKSPR